MLALIRREARALLSASKAGVNMWPHAVRHATERRLRRALAMLASPVKPMIPFWSRVTIRARTWSDKKWSSRAMQGIVVSPSVEVDGGWVVRTDSLRGAKFYVSTLLYLNAQPPLAPPDLTFGTEEMRDLRGSRVPSSRHRSKSPVLEASDVPPLDNAILKEPSHDVLHPDPVVRQRKKGVAAVAVGVSGAEGSVPVPGSFLDGLAREGPRGESLASSSVLRSMRSQVDKTVILEDSPRLCKVVGSNPAFQAFVPTAGYYARRVRVRLCRLTPAQWDAIRDLSRGMVPGLGELWRELHPDSLIYPVTSHPSDLVPLALYRNRARRWSQNPMVTAWIPPGQEVPLAFVRGMESSTTSSGGSYLVLSYLDVPLQEESVLLLWEELQVERVYQPLPSAPPRISCLSCVLHAIPPTGIGGGSVVLAWGGRRRN